MFALRKLALGMSGTPTADLPIGFIGRVVQHIRGRSKELILDHSAMFEV
jgi:hypothetical protein